MDPIVIEGITVDNTATVEGVTGYFSDPDGDDLTFTVGSSDTSVATGTASLMVTWSSLPMMQANADITVTATDPNDGEVEFDHHGNGAVVASRALRIGSPQRGI